MPQGLQDKILAMAYPYRPNQRLMLKASSMNGKSYFNPAAKGSSGRATFVSKDLVALKVGEWLVSKSFFAAAVKAWISVQRFNWWTTPYFKRNGLFADLQTRILLNLPTATISLLRWIVGRLEQWRNLKSLNIIISTLVFCAARLGSAYSRPGNRLWPETEIKRLLGHTRRSDLRGVRQCKFAVRHRHTFFESLDQAAMQNASRLETMLVDRLTVDTEVELGPSSNEERTRETPTADTETWVNKLHA